MWRRAHRTHVGGLLAVLLPLALAVHWSLALVVVYALWRTRSLAAWLSALAGLVILSPSWSMLAAGGAVGCVIVRHKVPPGAILDTTRARLLSWLYLARELTWFGHGPGSARLALEAAFLRSGDRAMDGGPARNEYLELLYEYGVLAAVGLLIAAVLIVPRLHWHDPISAALVAGFVVSAMTSPMRAFYRWLWGDRATLFGPPLRASLSVHLDQAGDAVLYGAEVHTTDRQLQAMIGATLIRLGVAWIHEHELSDAELEAIGGISGQAYQRQG